MQNYPTNIPASSYSSSPPPPIQKKERGLFLSFVLVVMTIGNVFGTFVLTFGGAAIDKATQDVSSVHHVVSRAVAVLTAAQIGSLACVCGIWAWKRWALFGYFAVTALAILADIKLTGELPYWLLLWAMAFLAAVFPRLSMFED